MTTLEQPELTFPSAPISGTTKAVVESVANDWLADGDWQRFVAAVHLAQDPDGIVDPNWVRRHLTVGGELTIRPRRLSAFYNRASSKAGFLDFSHWGMNEDHKGRNAGRPARFYKVRAA